MSDASERTWTDEYDTITEFFFWEPQHLNRTSRASREPWSTVRDKLRKKEIRLNHLLNIFFALAPEAMLSRLLSQATGLDALRPQPDHRTFQFCQPDCAFLCDDALIFLEMKLGAKCSEEQVLKYALAGLAAERSLPKALLLLGPHAAFACVDEIQHKAAAGILHLPDKLSSTVSRLKLSAGDLHEVVERLQISHWEYATLHAFLTSELQALDAGSEEAETLRKLMEGISQSIAEATGIRA